MLHDHYRVAFVPEFLQRVDELTVVPLVETDARLVQNIQDIDQFRSYLGGEPDSLAFASREGCGGPVE